MLVLNMNPSDQETKKFSKSPAFRKLALSLWSKTGDPSVYGLFDLDVTDLNPKSSLLGYVIKTLAHVVQENPELNCILKRGKIVPRLNRSISVMVNIPNEKKTDLSMLTITNPEQLSILEIEELISVKANKIRFYQDAELGPVMSLIQFLPRVFIRTFTWIYETLNYDFDISLKLKVFPKQPFGSVIVSNVGSLGIKNALLPLVPLARAVMLVSIGRITREPKVVHDKIAIRDIVQIGITFDHRMFDGSHAAKMLADFESHFEMLTKKVSIIQPSS